MVKERQTELTKGPFNSFGVVSTSLEPMRAKVTARCDCTGPPLPVLGAVEEVAEEVAEEVVAAVGDVPCLPRNNEEEDDDDDDDKNDDETERVLMPRLLPRLLLLSAP